MLDPLSLLAALSLADVFVDASHTSCATSDGTQQAPYCTIAEAVAAAANGDTIRIAPGTYRERLVIDKSLSLVGTRGDAVTIIDGESLDTVVNIPWPSNVHIEGVTITRGRGTVAGGIHGRATLVNSTVSHNVATLDGFHTSGGWLSPFNARAEGCRFIGNRSYGFPAAAAITCTGGDVEIERTTMTENEGEWVVMAFASDLVLRNSTITENTGTAAYLYEYGASGQLYSADVSDSTITRNVAPGTFGPRTGGLQVYGGGPVRLLNSIVADNVNGAGQGDLGARQSGPTPFHSNGHNFLGTVEGFPTIQHGLMGDQVGTLAAPLDPELEPLGHNGGRLETSRPIEGSPVIDRGTPVPFDQLDQRGVVRVEGSVDIGAHERGLGAQDPMCDAVPNSTGQVAWLVASGSDHVIANRVVATVFPMPAGSFGYLLTSRTTASIPQVGGGEGTLCLGGAIGRFVGPGQIMSTGEDGRFALTLDLTAHPTPTGLVSVQAGETWYLQGWFRDVLPGGGTSNLSTSVGVVFR